MTEPSDADRAKAAELLDELYFGGYSHDGAASALATYVASERAAAVADLRARVEAVAEAMEESGTLYFAARIRDALRAAVTDTTGGTQ